MHAIRSVLSSSSAIQRVPSNRIWTSSSTIEVRVPALHNPASGSCDGRGLVPNFILTVVDARMARRWPEAPSRFHGRLKVLPRPNAERSQTTPVLIHDLARAIEQQLSTPGQLTNVRNFAA